jgi:hypothetical protein
MVYFVSACNNGHEACSSQNSSSVPLNRLLLSWTVQLKSKNIMSKRNRPQCPQPQKDTMIRVEYAKKKKKNIQGIGKFRKA